MHRRHLLTSLPVFFSGCTIGIGETENDTTDSPSSTATETPAESDPDRTDSLYVENRTKETIGPVAVTVMSRDSDSLVHELDYRLPGETGVEIPDLGAVGEEYLVSVKLSEEAPVEETWTVPECQAKGDNANFGAQILDDGVAFVRNNCEARSVGQDPNIEYEHYREHVVVDRVDSLYMENWTDEIIEPLSVAVESEDELIHGGTYRVPPETGLEIPAVGEAGETYRVTAELPNWGEETTHEWTVNECIAWGTVVGNADAGIVLAEHDVEVVSNDCDAVSIGDTQDLDYVDHGAHLVNETA